MPLDSDPRGPEPYLPNVISSLRVALDGLEKHRDVIIAVREWATPEHAETLCNYLSFYEGQHREEAQKALADLVKHPAIVAEYERFYSGVTAMLHDEK